MKTEDVSDRFAMSCDSRSRRFAGSRHDGCRASGEVALRRLAGAVLAMVLACSAGKGQGEISSILLWRTQVQPIRLTGNARVDFLGQSALEPALQEAGSQQDVIRSYKSPWLAAGLSLAIPGSGELYTGSYWKSAAFLALDVAMWALAYSNDKRGDRQTDSYQDYANRNWSVVKYAMYAEGLVPAGSTYSWRIPGTEGRNPFDRPWEQVNWAELNRMERAIGATGPGQYYSHTLAPYNDQQYYEMIGKYQQFNQGWNDAPPSYTYPEPVTPNFTFYSKERGKANDYYTAASTFVTVAIINHVLSSADAAWSAHSANSIRADLGLRRLDGSLSSLRVPTLRLSYPM